MSKICLFIYVILYSSLLIAQHTPHTDLSESHGDVRLPLENYNQLIDSSKKPQSIAPAAYAIGQSDIKVTIQEHHDRTTAVIHLTSIIKTFEDKWASIPLMPFGTAVDNIAINDKPVQLIQKDQWLSWSTNTAGTSTLEISYTVDANRSPSGYAISIPTPRSASTTMTVDFPDADIDLAIIPSSHLKYNKIINNKHNKTRATATIPTTSSVLVSWRVATNQPYVISRADYIGKLEGDLINFSAEYDIEQLTGESNHIKLMPSSVTLQSITIDDQPATILEDQGHFNVVIKQRGKHVIKVNFQTQVEQQQGPPQVSFPILRVPISQFELQIPGQKDVSVILEDSGSVQTHQVINSFTDNMTRAKTHIPMTESVSFSWVDAIPKDIKAELRANANIYHAISAEEGVLYGQALIDYEITHGETNNLIFTLPLQAQVNQIKSATAGISDWIVKTVENKKVVTVFLDRAIKNNYQLNVSYEQLLETASNHSSPLPIDINVPLITAEKMHRQRGIVALLAGSELTLKPIKESHITRVGENQLPAFFRNHIALTIAHTFKYTSNSPELVVNTIAPERKKGKYDAQVDTLISLGEVTMRGSSSIEVSVKSGVIADLQLHVPIGINVLNVTGPSIRHHKVINSSSHQVIDIEFTQEMTGQFRIDFDYEKILSENTSELQVPSIKVNGTEVQHGRIAVEALTAIEVQASETTQLSSLSINELPQQLVLKTTNPILLAFKYVNTESPHSLKLTMTRHQELDVQVAAIESAHYQTLITNDGLAVTTALFFVQNSRRQFLRLNLPKNSEIWSVFVDGKAEKPALANNKDNNDVLIKMLNSVSGFPVKVVYATPIKKITMFGTLKHHLPLPDMVVTHTTWDVYLPIGPHYQSVTSNMQTVVSGQLVNPQKHPLNQHSDNMSTAQPLNIGVPQQGIKYTFAKLYANQSETMAGFEISYSSTTGNTTSVVLSIFSVLLIWLAIILIKKNQSIKVIAASLATGLVGLLVLNVYYHMDTKIAFIIALSGGVLFGITQLYSKITQWLWNKE